jgi:MarR family transcriptional regulator, organic hydroperoxide resistance regulator
MNPLATVLDCYPKIFFACHRRHLRDPRTKQPISSHQAEILDHLDPLTPTHLHQLAAHMSVTPSTMCLTIDRLEKAGFVLRRKDRHDARRVNLLLTAAGARIKRRQKVLDPLLVKQLLRHLSKSELNAALAGLFALASAADKLLVARQFKNHKKGNSQ